MKSMGIFNKIKMDKQGLTERRVGSHLSYNKNQISNFNKPVHKMNPAKSNQSIYIKQEGNSQLTFSKSKLKYKNQIKLKKFLERLKQSDSN